MDIHADHIRQITKYLSDEFSMTPDEIAEMLEIFFKSMEELNSSAESQIAESASDKLKETGHTIKGSAANISANRISELGLELENAGRNRDMDKCASTVAELKRAIFLLKSESQT